MTKFLLTCCTLGLLAAPMASAQEVSNERFQFSPLRIQYGLGSVRLEGMGGFLSAVPDENNEINLNDFGRNPAGFGDDRDSWVMESRYSHREYSQPVILDDQGEAMPVPFGVQDLTSREAVLSFSKYAPGRYGAGVRVDVGLSLIHI